ncbi:MAG: hypothetical protein IJI92_03250 [Erysipelotrichaceae bacterium]|nr:hypothetical protein [Erysipelotrichaceae bacterium]
MSKRKVLITSLIVIFMILVLWACGKKDQVPQEPDATDQLYKDKKNNEVVYIFQMDETTYMIDPAYEISLYGEELEDGKFYKLTADITYLNGGVAGYVNFPEIDNVISCEEISPYDISLPRITEKRYGLMIIGDYADGDIFLHEYWKMALWKDGEWIWKYDKEMDGEDGSLICYRLDVNEEDIKEGIAQGILSCEDYFVQPKIEN